jgi:hypothetical protein
MSTSGGGTPGDAPAGMVWGGNGWVPASTDPVTEVVNNSTTSGGVLGDGYVVIEEPKRTAVVSADNTWPAAGSAGEGMHWVRYKNSAGTWTYATEPDVMNQDAAARGSRLSWESGVDDLQEDPGWFGRQFQKAGYKYLGPGTDLSYNERNNVEPIDDLDNIAKIHDYDYRNVLDQYERGLISYSEASNLVADADRSFIERARLKPTVTGKLAGLGMTAKELFDSMLGPTFAGLYANRYGVRHGELGEPRDGDFVSRWNGYKWVRAYEPVFKPPFEDPSKRDNGKGYRSYGKAAYDDDRDRNYFPDRRQPLFRRRKRRRYY